jgi:hypothetical protein
MVYSKGSLLILAITLLLYIKLNCHCTNSSAGKLVSWFELSN